MLLQLYLECHVEMHIGNLCFHSLMTFKSTLVTLRCFSAQQLSFLFFLLFVRRQPLPPWLDIDLIMVFGFSLAVAELQPRPCS